MTRHYVVGSLTLKQFLFLMAVVFAVSATLLSILLTSAATATGSQPSLAISLVEGSNTGILGAGQARWFRMLPSSQAEATALDTTLALSFSPTPASPDRPVTLQLFEGGPTPSSRDDDLTTLTSLGLAQPTPGALIWQGRLSTGKTYYILLANQSDTPLEYQLLPRLVAVARSLPVVPAEVPTAAPLPAPAPATGNAPDQAISLGRGLTQGKLAPGARRWFTFQIGDPAQPAPFYTLKFTLFFTPDDGQRRQRVNYQLFTAKAVERWERGEEDKLANFGAGMLLARDGDPNTGERLWRGTVLDGETYFLVIENGADVEIDYWLFDDDVEHPELGG